MVNKQGFSRGHQGLLLGSIHNAKKSLSNIFPMLVHKIPNGVQFSIWINCEQVHWCFAKLLAYHDVNPISAEYILHSLLSSA